MKRIVRSVVATATMVMLALVLGFAEAQEPSALREKFEAVMQRMHEASREYFQKNWKDDLTEEQQKELYDKRPGPEFILELEALAVEAKGTDVEAAARVQVFFLECDFRRHADAEKTLARLLADSIGSTELESLPWTLTGLYAQFAKPGAMVSALETLIDKSPHEKVKASALFALAQHLCAPDSKDKERGRKCFARLVEEFGALDSGGRTYKEAAEGFLFELDHLQIGMVAPEVEAVDENGTKFKLSDYRGKVVVLDFWGMW